MNEQFLPFIGWRYVPIGNHALLRFCTSLFYALMSIFSPIAR